jgi:hypothetical protein
MIKLIRQKRSGDEHLLFKQGFIGVKENELSISFVPCDRRKTGYTVLMDEQSVRNMVDELLEFLSE